MSIDPAQFRQMVQDVLESIGKNYATSNAINLLVMTAAQETHLGRWLYQVRGPAQGIYQMEPNTVHDLWQNGLSNHMRDRIAEEYRPSRWSLKYDLAYQTILARLYYARFEEPIPANIREMAEYYKKYWNTEAGDATPRQALDNYLRYGVPGRTDA